MSTKKKSAEAAPKDKPAHHVQVGGVRIPIWRNEGEDGAYFTAGQPELSYKDPEGNWRTAKSYAPRHLVNLIKAAALAHSEVTLRNRAGQPPAEEMPQDQSGK